MEQMTQDEIDKLIEAALADNAEEDKIEQVPKTWLKRKSKWKSVVTALRRYEFVLQNGSFEDIREARRYLHHAAHSLWLVNHGFDLREDFKRWWKRKTYS